MFNEFDGKALWKACEYLNRDMAGHLAAHGKWHLDAGKLQTALDHAGVTGLKLARRMGKVFYSNGSGDVRPSGWYYQIDLDTPRGPYPTKKAASAAVQESAP